MQPETEPNQPPVTNPAPPAAPAVDPVPPAPPADVASETVAREEHLREVDRYRKQWGEEKKAKEELEKRLKALEDAGKSEAERLAAKAQQADELAPKVEGLTAEVETLRAALLAEVDEQKKALPKEMLDLLPADTSAAEQLAWVRKAKAAAEKLKPSGNGLPAAGGRNGGTKMDTEPTEAERSAASRRYANRF